MSNMLGLMLPVQCLYIYYIVIHSMDIVIHSMDIVIHSMDIVIHSMDIVIHSMDIVIPRTYKATKSSSICQWTLGDTV